MQSALLLPWAEVRLPRGSEYLEAVSQLLPSTPLNDQTLSVIWSESSQAKAHDSEEKEEGFFALCPSKSGLKLMNKHIVKHIVGEE